MKREFLFAFIALFTCSLFATSGKTHPAPPSLNFECAADEVVTKMKNGEFSCCPKGSNICYPSISSKIKKSKKCEPGENLVLMRSGDYACCPKDESVCYKLSE